MTAIGLLGILLIGGVKKFSDINHFVSFLNNLSKKLGNRSQVQGYLSYEGSGFNVQGFRSDK
jgi:hypothetical protein